MGGGPDHCADVHPDERLDGLRIARLSGIAVTLLSMAFNLVPIVNVPSPWIFGFKVGITGLAINIVGAVIYWRGTRRRGFETSKR